MADESKAVFPIIPVKNWWDLRKKFKQTIPISGVTDTYLSTVLGIGTRAAGNLLPDFKRVGIIDQDGVPKERAKAWRDDEQYPSVCDAIRKEVYPQELLDAFPSPSEDDKGGIERWFANRTGLGTISVKKMTSFYLMLSEADPAKMAESAKPKAEKPKPRPKQEPKVKVTGKEETVGTKIKSGAEEELGIPSININIEVHISADAEPTQIDKIFESMAKHLNIRRKTNNE